MNLICILILIFAFVDRVSAQPLPVHLCNDFNDGMQGWTAQNVAVTSVAGGPGGGKYLHCHDQSGPSYISAPASFRGDWRTEKNCTRTICYDARIFIDGLSTSNNYSIGVRLMSGSGCAVYHPSQLMSEDGSTNQGWHHVCASLGPGMSTATPPGWTVLSGTWSNIIANVTDVRFGFDVGSTQTEQFGFDNICVDIACDPPPCDCCMDSTKAGSGKGRPSKP